MINSISKVTYTDYRWLSRNFNTVGLINIVLWSHLRHKIKIFPFIVLFCFFFYCNMYGGENPAMSTQTQQIRVGQLSPAGCVSSGHVCPWWLRLMTPGVSHCELGEGSHIWVKNQQSPLKRLWIKVLLCVCVCSVSHQGFIQKAALIKLVVLFFSRMKY